MRGLPGPPSASPATNHKKAGGKRLKKKRSSGASLLDLSKMENAMPAAMTALNLVKMAMYLRGKNGVIADGSTDGQSLGNYLGTTLSTQPKIRFVMVNPVKAMEKMIAPDYDSKSLDSIQKMTNLDFYLCSTSDSTNKTAQHMRLECVPQPRIVYTTVTDIRTEKAAAFFDLGDVSQGESKTTYDGIKAHIKNHTTKALIAQLVLKDSLAAAANPKYQAYITKAKNLDIPQFDTTPYTKPDTIENLPHYFKQSDDNAETPDFYNKFIFDDLLEISKYKLSLFVEKATNGRYIKYRFTEA